MRATEIVDPAHWPDRNWFFDPDFDTEHVAKTFVWFLDKVHNCSEQDFVDKLRIGYQTLNVDTGDAGSVIAGRSMWQDALIERIIWSYIAPARQHIVYQACGFILPKDKTLSDTESLPHNPKSYFLRQVIRDYIDAWFINVFTKPDEDIFDSILEPL